MAFLIGQYIIEAGLLDGDILTIKGNQRFELANQSKGDIEAFIPGY